MEKGVQGKQAFFGPNFCHSYSLKISLELIKERLGKNSDSGLKQLIKNFQENT